MIQTILLKLIFFDFDTIRLVKLPEHLKWDLSYIGRFTIGAIVFSSLWTSIILIEWPQRWLKISSIWVSIIIDALIISTFHIFMANNFHVFYSDSNYAVPIMYTYGRSFHIFIMSMALKFVLGIDSVLFFFERNKGRRSIRVLHAS